MGELVASREALREALRSWVNPSLTCEGRAQCTDPALAVGKRIEALRRVMDTFEASETGVVVRAGSEGLAVDAWGESSVRVRSTLGVSVTETPGSALTGMATPAHVEVGDHGARVRNGDLVVEISVNDEDRFVPFPPLVRFLTADGRELLAETRPHFASPAQRRYRRGGGDLYACELAFDADPSERFYGLG